VVTPVDISRLRLTCQALVGGTWWSDKVENLMEAQPTLRSWGRACRIETLNRRCAMPNHLGDLVRRLRVESEQGEGVSPTAGLVNLGGGKGQESIGFRHRLTARVESTDAQLEQGSKVGGPRQREIMLLDRGDTAELRYESPCNNPGRSS
jgi:hypothetical protein